MQQSSNHGRTAAAALALDAHIFVSVSRRARRFSTSYFWRNSAVAEGVEDVGRNVLGHGLHPPRIMVIMVIMEMKAAT